MDLIRVLLEGIRDLQLIQALDERLGTRAGYRILAAGCDIEIPDTRRDFLGCLQSLFERLRFTENPAAENTQGRESVRVYEPGVDGLISAHGKAG